MLRSASRFFPTRNRSPTPIALTSRREFSPPTKRRRISQSFLHHEMAQTPIYPSKLFFFCPSGSRRGRRDADLPLRYFVGSLAGTNPRLRRGLPGQGFEIFQRHASRSRRVVRYGAQLAKHFQRGHPRSRGGALGQARLLLGMASQWRPPRHHASASLPCAISAMGASSFFNQLIAAFNGWKDARNDPVKGDHVRRWHPARSGQRWPPPEPSPTKSLSISHGKQAILRWLTTTSPCTVAALSKEPAECWHLLWPTIKPR